MCRNPKIIDPSRRHRIATGSGVPPQQVNELIKQFDGMKSIMESMAGKGVGDRMRMVRELQQGGLLDPGGKIAKQKKGTGKRQRPRVGAKELKRRQKDRKRNAKRNKRKRR